MDPEPIDNVITPIVEAAMRLIVKDAIGTISVENRQREKVLRRNKGPGLGLPFCVAVYNARNDEW
jgi:hypothetical protein